jgi:hypothetical protein
MDHAAVMNACDKKAEKLGLSALTSVERTVVLVSIANFEIELGGLTSFFYNTAGNAAQATVAALVDIGAERAAFALRRANALFPGGNPAVDRERRFKDYKKLMESDDRAFNEMDSEFYAEDPDVFSKLCTFIDAHADELRKYDVKE